MPLPRMCRSGFARLNSRSTGCDLSDASRNRPPISESVPWSLDSDGPLALTVGNAPESAVVRFNAEFRRTTLTGGDSESILPEDAFTADVPQRIRPVELAFHGLRSQRCIPKSSF